MSNITEEARKQFPYIKNRSLDQYCKREGFEAGAEWMKEKAIEALNSATNGYFIIGGINYSNLILEKFKQLINE